MKKITKMICVCMIAVLSATSAFAAVGDPQTIEPAAEKQTCLLYTSPSPRDRQKSRMPSSA